MKFEDLIIGLGLSVEEYERFKKNHQIIDISDLLITDNKITFPDITNMIQSSSDGQEEENINE